MFWPQCHNVSQTPDWQPVRYYWAFWMRYQPPSYLAVLRGNLICWTNKDPWSCILFNEKNILTKFLSSSLHLVWFCSKQSWKYLYLELTRAVLLEACLLQIYLSIYMIITVGSFWNDTIVELHAVLFSKSACWPRDQISNGQYFSATDYNHCNKLREAIVRQVKERGGGV